MNKVSKPSDRGSGEAECPQSLRLAQGQPWLQTGEPRGSRGQWCQAGRSALLTLLTPSVTLWHLLSLWASLSSVIKCRSKLNSSSEHGSSEELGETWKLVSNCQETLSAFPDSGFSALIHQYKLIPAVCQAACCVLSKFSAFMGPTSWVMFGWSGARQTINM